MQGKRIAILENRLGSQLTELVARGGGIPLHAPALAELPDGDPQALGTFLDGCAAEPPHLFIFQTGVGAQSLLDIAAQIGRSAELLGLLSQTKVAARGPKPAGVLRSHGVRIDFTTVDPHTSAELMAAVDSHLRPGMRVVVQRYGESNRVLDAALHARGAQTVELPAYRWSLPADTGPLTRMLDALDGHALDAVVFTSASQVRNLFQFAGDAGRETALRAGLSNVSIFSIGPICSAALRAAQVRIDAEASPPKLGPLLALLRERLA